ncbi:MAG: hypothetical protein K2X77_00465 [Candidatus Obscuribacterales bacterium]|nr:hypothetical protein [Candidatus Obscuribacterales bacterium]
MTSTKTARACRKLTEDARYNNSPNKKNAGRAERELEGRASTANSSEIVCQSPNLFVVVVRYAQDHRNSFQHPAL